MMPPKKADVPFTLCHWKKKRNVRSSPMTKARPDRNRICGQASTELAIPTLPSSKATYVSDGEQSLVEKEYDAEE